MLLRYVIELTPKEIGAVLERKTTTVQQQLTRAKQALASLYIQEGLRDA
jgi:DNA-directed RNA polymerase specialized sigma24 family protein